VARMGYVCPTRAHTQVRPYAGGAAGDSR